MVLLYCHTVNVNNSLVWLFSDPIASKTIRQIVLADEPVGRPTRKPQASLFRGAVGTCVHARVVCFALFSAVVCVGGVLNPSLSRRVPPRLSNPDHVYNKNVAPRLPCLWLYMTWILKKRNCWCLFWASDSWQCLCCQHWYRFRRACRKCSGKIFPGNWRAPMSPVYNSVE